VKIVRYTEDRMDEWLEILHEADKSYFSPERYEIEAWDIDEIRDDLVAYDDGGVLVAVAAAASYSSIGSNIYKIYVTPEYRRRHLGTLLVLICECALRREGCKFCVLQVDSDNIPNLMLLSKLGYAIVKIHEESLGMQWVELCKSLI